ncbi:hypothetical protein ACFFMN_08925 [Planobispora siamensis]|uniref:Uncharacterized protein n=1 Tax=Planobispora siamensis TaxID=936338 RepID=A0A8J3SFK4_9ACTN|nr:hypothetical protein [Planobispora siamensis]GIH91104.1 hypothetical protein Psi01_17340 [Planobispora siamensis]
MRTGEPDWTYVARSLVKVLAVTAALFLALSGAERALRLFVDFGDERWDRVHGTAARVVDPDARLRGYNGDNGVSGALAVMDGDNGRDEHVAEKARKIIDGLPPTLEAAAIVEFAHPMSTEPLVDFNRKNKICGGADVSYIYLPSFFDDSSDPSSLSAVVWNRDMTLENTWVGLSYECETEPRAALAEFRRWVGLVDEGDDLSEFELEPGWLAGAAKEGAVYGLVVDGWKLADLGKLLGDPRVRTVVIADVAFDLGDDEYGVGG